MRLGISPVLCDSVGVMSPIPKTKDMLIHERRSAFNLGPIINSNVNFEANCGALCKKKATSICHA